MKTIPRNDHEPQNETWWLEFAATYGYGVIMLPDGFYLKGGRPAAPDYLLSRSLERVFMVNNASGLKIEKAI